MNNSTICFLFVFVVVLGGCCCACDVGADGSRTFRFAEEGRPLTETIGTNQHAHVCGGVCFLFVCFLFCLVTVYEKKEEKKKRKKRCVR